RRPARGSQAGHDRQPGPESVLQRAQLAFRIGGFVHRDGPGAGRSDVLPADQGPQLRWSATAVNTGLPRWLIAVAGVVYFFLHLPIMVLVVFSFNASKFSVDWRGFTLQWYQRLLERPDILRGLKASLIVGGAATVISAVLGTLLALALGRQQFRGRRAFEGFLYVPIVTPEIVTGISLLLLFALVKVPLGLTTITIAHVAFCISFVVIVVLARIQGMDDNLEEAAMILGADEITTFWKITVPQLWP